MIAAPIDVFRQESQLDESTAVTARVAEGTRTPDSWIDNSGAVLAIRLVAVTYDASFATVDIL